MVDGLSAGILLKELALAYSRRLHQTRAPAFGDYMAFLQRQSNEAALRYWVDYLDGARPCYFPTLRAEPSPSHLAETKTVVINTGIAGLQAFCKGQGVTIPTLMQAVWGTVLRYYTQSDDVCFAYIASGRGEPIAGINTMVGTLIHLLICRIRFGHSESFQDLLQTLQSELGPAMLHQYTSLSRIQNTLLLGGRPLFNTLMSIIYTPSIQEGEVLDIDFDQIITSTTSEVRPPMWCLALAIMYDISLSIDLSATNLAISIIYRTSTMSEDAADSLAGSFTKVMDAVVQNPGNPSAEVHIISDNDLARMASYQTLMPITESCTHWLIGEQVRLRPDNPAVVSWDRDLTYAELNLFASRLATMLHELGVGPDVIVPICFPKSAWAVVTMVAVEMAGGAFVTLDPAAPPTRLRNILQDTGATIAIAAPGYQNLVQKLGMRTVTVNEEIISALPDSVGPGSYQVLPHNLSFIIFTSGSTGNPKGIAIEHRGICSTVAGYGEALQVGPGKRVFCFSAYTFDMGVMDVLGTLMRGGCVCVPSEHARINDLAGAINATKANWLFLTPTVADLLSPNDVPGLELLAIGGEAISKKTADRWKGKIHLCGLYGPAEVSICAFQKALGVCGKPTNIGKPLRSAFWVVDPADVKRLVPVGCIGELLIQSPMLARGYLNANDRAAANWLEGFDWLPGLSGPTRLYRSGDLVRCLDDGTFEFIGRKDTQIKLHGQRVELGEIESRLHEVLPAEANAMVDVIWGSNGGPDMLVSVLWVVGGPNFRPTEPFALIETVSWETRRLISDLNSYLSMNLPSYMVPSSYLVFQGIPRQTISGKVDRRYLSTCARETSADERLRFSPDNVTGIEEATTATELTLRELWASILRVGPELIGRNSNFFQLGGDSIAAMRLVTAARQMRIALDVATVLRSPVLNEMASKMGVDDREFPIDHCKIHPFTLIPDEAPVDAIKDEVSKLCRVEPKIVLDVYPCTPLQTGLLALSYKQPTSYIGRMVYSLPQNLDLDSFKRAWSVAQLRNDILRTRIVDTKVAGIVQVVLSTEEMDWRDAGNLTAYLNQDSDTPMTTGRPLSRYSVVDEGDSRRYFIWTAHHALYDAFSLPLIMGQVERAYLGIEQEDLTPFTEFIKHIQSSDVSAAETFWRAQLAGSRKMTFPAPPPNGKLRVDGEVVRKMSIPTGASLEVTLATVLRAAWAVVLGKHSAMDDILYGAVVTGRSVPVSGIEKVAGPTVATIPLRVRLPRDIPIREFLQNMQELGTDIIPYEQHGFNKIAELAGEEENVLSIQSLFVVQPAEEGKTTLSKLGLSNPTMHGVGFHTQTLVFECHLSKQNVEVHASFDANVLSESLMHFIIAQFETVVHQLCTQSSNQVTVLGDIDALSELDKMHIRKWNKRLPEVVTDCAHEIFERRAREQPDAAAIVFSSLGMSFTYSQLDRASSRLAGRLLELGVGPDDFVPLCFEKSPMYAVAQLAVMKSGGAFVPLEPSNPLPRRLHIIRQLNGAKVVVVSPSTVSDFPSNAAEHFIELSECFLASLPDPVKPSLAGRAVPRDAAYCLFTSGSTGIPKGVVVEHEALCSSSRNHGRALNMTKDTRALQFSAHGFDANIIETLTTLMMGGCVCVPSEEARMNNIAQAMREMDVNWALFTPSFSRLVDARDVPCLKTLVLGGEAVKQENVDQWLDKVQLMGAYGPVELAAIATVQDLSQASPSTIGCNTSSLCHVVEVGDVTKLSPVGCVGELVAQGPSLARGYLNDDAKTSAVFLAGEDIPFLADDTSGFSKRLYRTGDLVRRCPDGNLEYVGRIDDEQVKLNGQRIEVGEIEHHLGSSACGAKQIAVVVVKGGRGFHRDILAAFLCFDGQRAESGEGQDGLHLIDEATREAIADVANGLALNLPRYMVPSLFIPLHGRLPLTLSGKADRAKLVEMVQCLSEAEVENYSLMDAEKRPATTEMELALRNLWALILDREPESIGVDDSFLRLGGDSISAMRLVSAARQQGITLSVASIFEDPRLCKVAAMATRENQNELAIEPFALLPGAVTDIIPAVESQCATHFSEVEDVYPCTPLQEGVMASSMKQHGSYVARHVLRIPLNIDIDKLRNAWCSVVGTHPVLRTRIVQVPSGWPSVQVVMRKGFYWQANVDLQEYLKADSRSLLTYGAPLVRFAIATDRDSIYLVLTIHHAIYDGWSLPIILNDVRRAYEGLELAKTVPYNIFVNYLRTNDHEASDAYWRSKLDGAKVTDFPRLPNANASARTDASLRFTMSCPRAKTSEITLATTLRAGWAILLSNYTDSRDVTFGSTSSGRNAPLGGIDVMVGPTITTVPVRIQLDSPTKLEFLRAVQRQGAQAIMFEQRGLANIAKLGPHAREACSFRTLLVVQVGDTQAELLGMASAAEAMNEGFYTYPFILECVPVEGDDSVRIDARFNANVISSGQVLTVLHQYAQIISQLATPTDCPLDAIDMFSQHDRDRIAKLNSDIPEALPGLAHDLIKRHSESRPELPAICAWDGDFTYAELDAVSTRIARCLVSLGVGPETFVPFCIEKSAWAIIAMVSIMKAGGAFVPLDPSHPAARRQTVVGLVNAKVMLVTPLTRVISDGLTEKVVELSSSMVNQMPDESSLPMLVRPENAAYTMFTSGTTGTPKGVVIEHQALSTAARKFGQPLKFNSSSRVLQFASYVFDASVLETIVTLVHGGCICIPSDASRVNNLAGAINSMNVNWTILTPSVARLLTPELVPGLNTIMIGGEPVGADNIETWYGKAETVLLYGPTEATMVTASYEVKSGNDPPTVIGSGAAGPLGAFWIADANNHDRLVPWGCVGELLIQGPLLARGYYGDKATTSAAFIDGPAWLPEQPSSCSRRLYKTGDLGRYTPEGFLECLGRKDTQVKLRGLRIELGEVEHQVRSNLSDVGQVVVEVVPTGKAPQDSSLVAFFSLKESSVLLQSIDVRNLRPEEPLPMTHGLQIQLAGLVGALRERLPIYMIPSFFVAFRRIPTVSSGKTDRTLLRNLVRGFSKDDIALYSLATGEKRAPSTQVEHRLRSIWAAVLGINEAEIGADDSFLQLGGDSITAMRLISASRLQGIRLTVGTVFDFPRLSQMALHVQVVDYREENTIVEPFELLPPSISAELLHNEVRKICGVGSHLIQDAYPCSPLQEGLLVLTEKQPRAYIMQTVFQLPAEVDLKRLEDAWRLVEAMNPILRTRILCVADTDFIQVVINEGQPWNYGYDISKYLETDLSTPMHLETPLARWAIVRDTETAITYFVWTMHHAIYDGWSMRLMLECFHNIYEGQQPASPTPYSHFIRYISKLGVDASATWWRSQLEDAPTTYFPRAGQTKQKSGQGEIWHRLFTVSAGPDMAVTKATLIRAAWALLLSRYGEEGDVVFGTTVSGRSAAIGGVESMIGPLIATVPVRVRLERGQTVADFLAGIQKQHTDMVPHEQFGLQNISKLSLSAHQACDFQSLLVIHPPRLTAQDREEVLLDIKPRADLTTTDGSGFFSYPLVFQCHIGEKNDFDMSATYDSGILTRAEVENLGLQFETVMQRLAGAGQLDTTIDDINPFSAHDFEQVRAWNEAAVPDAVEVCIHTLFEQQALLRPLATAISAWDGTLTYYQLDLAANRLAHHILKSYPIKPGDMVPIYFEKSLWVFVAMLAINKAGAAWVPLDPSHPEQRHRSVVEQTNTCVILSSRANASRAERLHSQVILVGRMLDHELIARMGDVAAPETSVTSDHPIYVLFTSGSTGVPKGMVMRHGGVSTAMTAIRKRIGMTPSVRILQFASYVFDLCIGEILLPLVTGACVCVPSDSTRTDDIATFIKEQGITWAFFTPSYARLLRPEDVPSIELLLLAGEAVGLDHLRTWVGKVRLWNGWGPSECCLFSSLREFEVGDSPLNVGHPVGGRCWIVQPDDPSQLTPVGCVGEVVIQGPTIALEYLGDPVKTSAAVVTELPEWAPVESIYYNRFFKSGDLAYYNPDGSIQFVSRKDTQVKVRGFRIELSEIEHHIRVLLPAAEQIAVGLFKRGTETSAAPSTLAAYLCFSGNTHTIAARTEESSSVLEEMLSPMTEELRLRILSLISDLEVALPKYMIPTVFIPLRYMPFVTAQKLDRITLSNISLAFTAEQLAMYSLRDTASVKHSPETEMERTLQSLWAAVLNVNHDTIGREDNFLRIGGDSIAAIRLVTLARERGVSLTVKDIFDEPRLAGMAAKARQRVAQNEDDFEGEPSQTGVLPFSLLDEPLRQAVIQQAAELCGVSADVVKDAYPCTPLQLGLIVLAEKKTGSYTTRNVFKLPDDIDIELFKKAWEQTVMKCETLRTRIIVCNGATIQVVLREAVSWQVPGVGDGLSEFISHQKMLPMGHGTPLSRYGIVHDSGDVYFVWTVHHSVYDGWCLPQIFGMLLQAYRGESDSDEKLSPFKAYIDYVLSLNNEDSAEFWRREMSVGSPVHFPSPPLKRSIPAKQEVIVHTITSARRVGSDSTTSTLLRAAWTLVLSRWTESSTVGFGTVVSGRNAPVAGIEKILGPTLATLPLVVQVSSDMTVSQLLAAMQEQHNAMIHHEHFGVQNIASLSDSAREACNFKNLLAIQPAHHINNALGIEVVHTIEEHQGYHTYPLVVECLLNGDMDAVTLRVTFDSSTLPRLHAQSICHHFEHVVNQLVSCDGSLTLDQISVFSPRDEQQVISWNQQISTESISTTVQAIFAQVAGRNPQHEAIFSFDGRYTYAQLDGASQRLGCYLSTFGIGPGCMVPLCFEHSSWYIVAVLAVLKTGAAFVPLDPKHPLDRRRDIVSQLDTRILVGSPLGIEKSAGLAEILVPVSAALDERLIQMTAHSDIRVTSRPDDVAYVIFTSGTTGTPKGVVIQHKAVCTASHNHLEPLGLQRMEKRVLQVASHVFDASISEIITTLIHGGTVCVPSDEQRMDPRELSRFMNTSRVDWALFSPIMAKMILPQMVPSLKTVVIGGDLVTPDVVQPWMAAGVHVINAAGPTETCVVLTCKHIKNADDASIIGRGVGYRTWVVEPENPQALTPVGCVGELLAQGPSLAKGYLHDDIKTRGSFIRALEWAHLDERACNRLVYRTGDLVRYVADGNLEYMGRKDTQIKLHSQRIELGDIEQHVRSALPDIPHIGVEVISSDTTDSLAVFFCLGDNVRTVEGNFPSSLLLQLGAPEMRRFTYLVATLENTLPTYMIPSVFLPLSFVPVTTSGKMNRKLLRQLGSSLSSDQIRGYLLDNGDGHKRAPETSMEIRLHGLWATVLHIPPESIGLESNFLRLGGDSIAAMKLVSAAQDQGIALTVAIIFEHPHLAEMATAATALVANAHGFEVDSTLVPFGLLDESMSLEDVKEQVAEQCHVTTDQIRDVYPLTTLQEGVFGLSLRTKGTYVARNVFRLPSSTDVDRLKRAWETTCQLHDILATRIVLLNGEAFQALVSSPVAWQDSSNLHGYITHCKNTPMSYGMPLARYAIVHESGSDDRYMVWTVHHTIYDGWSARLVLETLQATYRGLETPQLVPFSRFIHYLRNTSDPQASADFWREQAQGADLTPFPRRLVTAVEDLPPHWSRIRQSLSMNRGTANQDITTNNLLRAAWALTLAAHSNSQDVVFGVTVSGRNAAMRNIERVAGPTFASLPVHLTVDGGANLATFLRHVQKLSIDTIPHQDFGLRKIRELGPQGSNLCAFQTLLVIQTTNEEYHDGEGSILQVTQVPDVDEVFSSYPITLECFMHPDSIEINCHHDASVIPTPMVEIVVTHFRRAFERLFSQNSDSQLVGSVISAFDEDEQAIREWNTEALAPVDTCLHTMVERQAVVRPNYRAIHSWDLSLTYDELQEAADILAEHLINAGVQIGDLVPVCFEKSAWAIVSMLAIMKAGAGFVPLDPAHPIERRQQIIEETAAKTVLVSPTTETTFRDMQSSITAIIIVVSPTFVQSLRRLRSGRPAGVHPPSVRPDHIAYVYYTSGSTGRPKGVVVDHRAICTSISAQAEAFGITAETRSISFASFVFDAAILEIFGALTQGGCVNVPSDTVRLNGLSQFMCETKTNFAFFTPMFITTLSPDDVPDLQVLVLGGESVRKESLKVWLPRVTVYEAYGPTETTVISTVHHLTSPDEAPIIGKGIGCRTWIAKSEDYNSLVPVGCVGELLIQGPVLARGYLNDQENSDAAFVTPSWLLSGKFNTADERLSNRVYRTGDLVRYSSSGSLEYVGRRDEQIKIRGQRLEPGEIEYQITKALGGNTQAAITLITDPNGSGAANLAAFIKFDGTLPEPDSIGHEQEVLLLPVSDQAKQRFQELIRGLSRTLPEYMVPTLFFPVRVIPLSTSGKIDTRRLQQMALALSQDDLAQYSISASATKRPPRNEMESTLQALWSTTLRIPTDLIGADDDFYLLGGDSIRIITLAKRIREMFGIELGLSQLNSKNTTIQGLAEFIQKRIRGASSAEGAEEPKIDLMAELSPLLRMAKATASVEGLVSDPSVVLPEKATVLLTGATGFLGIEILRQLLCSDRVATVIALVRARSPSHGMDRIKETAQVTGWWESHVNYATKLEVWTGDLSLARLGLEDANWDRLCGQSAAGVGSIDAILHNGAMVNWNADFEKLRAPNVQSTVDLLRASAVSPTCPKFVYVSGGVKIPDMQTNRPATVVHITSGTGYVQTKFLSESFVYEVASHLPPHQNRVSIVKPGLIIGNAGRGVANVDDFVWRIVAASIAVGAYPTEERSYWIHLADAHTVAAAVIRQIFQSEDMAAFVDVDAGMDSDRFWNLCAEVAPMLPLPREEWSKLALRDMENVGGAHPLWPVQHFVGRLSSHLVPAEAEVVMEKEDRLRLEEAVRSNLRYLVRVGFISVGDSAGEGTGLRERVIRRS
ncbi:hypothetical protein B0T19DRAFT_461502 [Cercophora scortea]|uniref:Carrier domain-containing protein n=1 Tax=Cercophora scortea TaxID=314031 RepID=A0AAE0MD71_9PEZI|nr:hypothetical protein B0T19DRAFT_461502 [Cercophora scortea]